MATKGSRKDPAWPYSIEIPIECGKKRVKEHLACTHRDVSPCPNVPDEVKEEICQYLKTFETTKFMAQRNFEENVECGAYFVNPNISSSPSVNDRGVRGPMDRFLGTTKDDEQGTVSDEKMTPARAKEHRNRVCLDIERCFYENVISFNVATSPSFIGMVRSIGQYGRDLKPPTSYELRTWILNEKVKTTTTVVDDIKATWKKPVVNNQYGTVFLNTFDASDCIKNAHKLFELLDAVIEEIGEELVVQVVTDNASAYKAVGELLMEKKKGLYWTPCAAHLMLEKIGDLLQNKYALLKAKKKSAISSITINGKFAEKDLLRPAITRFATSFFILESLHGLKQPLQSMFVSREWSNCAWAKKDDGKVVKKIVMDEKTFWSSVVYSIKTSKPLIHVLRIVDGEKEPAMAYIYGAMDECKEKIASNFNGDVSQYKEIWDIIDEKW
uniref:DUF659 domain-containing protein n=1 Tax=Lactuca sativa TaxID=4236 RepID=A0A9R1UH50_LACSA|nr:hypothetical protein LSAT_V11C900478660 [Lactuca sativa]